MKKLLEFDPNQAYDSADYKFTSIVLLYYTLIYLLNNYRNYKRIDNSKIDKEMTKTISNIIGDESIEIRELSDLDKDPKSFYIKKIISRNIKTVVYTSSLKSILSEKELISTILFELGENSQSHLRIKKWRYVSNTLHILLTSLISAEFGRKLPGGLFSISKFMGQSITGDPKFKRIFRANIFVLLLGLGSFSLFNYMLKRKEEYSKDAFPIRFGYGNEWINAMKKIRESYYNNIKSYMCPPNKSEEECKKLLKRKMGKVITNFEKREEKIQKEIEKMSPKNLDPGTIYQIVKIITK